VWIDGRGGEGEGGRATYGKFTDLSVVNTVNLRLLRRAQA